MASQLLYASRPVPMTVLLAAGEPPRLKVAAVSSGRLPALQPLFSLPSPVLAQCAA
ncbi:hypothetical protein [Amycolatopsis orientalis]|uniref:hypothetical protein n=1 Tax=Amycolatopsis orientalis TaxID=31958 RepID=UPI0003A2CEC3|nr:hypothetical protein [Amycolatopsis orientalis]